MVQDEVNHIYSGVVKIIPAVDNVNVWRAVVFCTVLVGVCGVFPSYFLFLFAVLRSLCDFALFECVQAVFFYFLCVSSVFFQLPALAQLVKVLAHLVKVLARTRVKEEEPQAHFYNF